MRYALVSSALAAVAAAAPLEERQATAGGPNNDAAILNYALTLEYLEREFYKEGLAKFSAQDFVNAGASPDFRNNLEEIYYDEKTHVATLAGALTAKNAVQQCDYNFGVTDAASFLAVDQVLEGVGVSAYLGAAQYIKSGAYLEVAGAILTVEARHDAYIRLNENPSESPFPSAFDIPLDFDQVYSLAAQFITSCPSGNAGKLGPLNLKAFPAITVAPHNGPIEPGCQINLKVAKSVNAVSAYFITLMGPVPAKFTGKGNSYTVTIPQGLPAGQDYLVLTNDKSGNVTDANTVAGPAVVQVCS